MKRRTLLTLLASGPAFAAPDKVFEPSFGDFADELRQLAPRKKQALLLFFEMEACPFCHRLHRDVLSQSAVRAMLERDFLAIRVDTQGLGPITTFDGRSLTEAAFSKEQKVRGTPSILAFDASGRELARLAGAPSSPEEFLLFGRYALSGQTAALSFAQFKQQARR